MDPQRRKIPLLKKALARSRRRSESETPPPPSPPSLKQPWRKVCWGNTDSDLKYLKSYRPESVEVQHLRILLHGPVGAGKSSFINSVNNILQGRMSTPALVNAKNAERSFTKKYETHQFRKESGTFHHFVFNDTMGLEDESGSGVLPEDIVLAMNGHMMENYKFNPVSALSKRDPGFRSFVTMEDKTHVLVIVFSANAPVFSESIVSKMNDIREMASDLGIPQLAVLTHIDDTCEEIERDVKNVYKSKTLLQKMKDFSAAVGIPMNCIFPVKNYSSEISLDADINALILSALRQMIHFGEDFINTKSSEVLV
ncbi:interferon-induced protein 44-like [Genypterus blacodes]|uniref:interferon-induced protein 44-like n=1 Tax=Genypterus blacodes TaxID=154954 RepID=UPI003F75B2BA